MATDIRQFCNACGRKIIEGHCPDPCQGDGRGIYVVEHPQGYEYTCRAASEADAIKVVAGDKGWDQSITDDCTAIEVE